MLVDIVLRRLLDSSFLLQVDELQVASLLYNHEPAKNQYNRFQGTTQKPLRTWDSIEGGNTCNVLQCTCVSVYICCMICMPKHEEQIHREFIF